MPYFERLTHRLIQKCSGPLPHIGSVHLEIDASLLHRLGLRVISCFEVEIPLLIGIWVIRANRDLPLRWRLGAGGRRPYLILNLLLGQFGFAGHFVLWRRVAPVLIGSFTATSSPNNDN